MCGEGSLHEGKAQKSLSLTQQVKHSLSISFCKILSKYFGTQTPLCLQPNVSNCVCKCTISMFVFHINIQVESVCVCNLHTAVFTLP